MLLSYSFGLIAVFLWALIPLLVKAGLEQIPLTYFLFLRFAVSSLIFLPFFKALYPKLKKTPISLLFSLLVCIGLNYLLQSLAIKDLPVSAYILIFALNPILALLMMRIPLTRNLLLSIVLAISGVFLFLNFDSQENSSATAYSYLFLMGGMLTWVLYTFIASRLQKHMNDIELTATTNYASLVASAILWSGDGLPTMDFAILSNASWAALALSAIGMPIAYYCYLYCLRRLPIFSQLSQYLELIFGLIFAFMFTNESITPLKALGVLLILGTLVISSKEDKKTT